MGLDLPDKESQAHLIFLKEKAIYLYKFAYKQFKLSIRNNNEFDSPEVISAVHYVTAYYNVLTLVFGLNYDCITVFDKEVNEKLNNEI